MARCGCDATFCFDYNISIPSTPIPPLTNKFRGYVAWWCISITNMEPSCIFGGMFNSSNCDGINFSWFTTYFGLLRKPSLVIFLKIPLDLGLRLSKGLAKILCLEKVALPDHDWLNWFLFIFLDIQIILGMVQLPYSFQVQEYGSRQMHIQALNIWTKAGKKAAPSHYHNVTIYHQGR